MVSHAHFKDVLGNSVRRYDRGGMFFYDQLSTLHKLMRDSSPDSAFTRWWLCTPVYGALATDYYV